MDSKASKQGKDSTPSLREAEGIIAAIKALPFKSSSARHALARDPDLGNRFERFVLGTMIDGALDYNAVFERHDGTEGPCGEEYRAGADNRWAFVLPDVDGGGRYRVQLFDLDGFSGHRVHATLTEAVEDMVSSGFRTWDHGRLEAVGSRPRWARGVLVAGAHQRFNDGGLTFAEYTQVVARIYEEAAPAVEAAGNLAPA